MGGECCGKHGVPCFACPFPGAAREPKVGCHFCGATAPKRITAPGTLPPQGWSVGRDTEGLMATDIYACGEHGDDLRRLLGLGERPSDG